MPQGAVRELRLALTVEDYDQAVAFYRDGLGLPVVESFEGPDGGGVVLDAGRATLELLSLGQAEMVDRVEVGSRVAEALAEPVVTPWRHRNVRVRAPDGMQLTLFTVLDDAGASGEGGT
jgi:lactoylglutathione lyase